MEEYDQLLYEDDSTNRMCESLLLFDEIVNSKWFVNSSIVLVMNKVDLFREKIRTKSLKQAFPHYHGGNSYTKAVMYIKEMFESKNRNKQKKIYTIMTEATSTFFCYYF
jgi:GTPase SAR1 family protein